MNDYSETMKAKVKRWKNNIPLFAFEVFGVTFDAWQQEAAIKFGSTYCRRLAMKACKGPGKTMLLAIICWWFLVTRFHSEIIATSITGPNLSDGLWKEMDKWRSKSKLLQEMFDWNKESIVMKKHRSTWFMVARQFSKDATPDQQADTLAGKHMDNMLFVIDEAGGVPDSVMVAAEAALSSGVDTRIVIAGNPTHRTGPLFRACHTDRALWEVVEITGDPKDPNRSPRIDIKWAQDQIDMWGADNPYVLVNIFGKFPPASLNSLLGPEEIEAAFNVNLEEEQYMFAQKRIGIDVGRFGDDETVLFPRQGLAAFRPIILRSMRTNEIADRVVEGKQRWGSEIEFIDCTGGYGGGVEDDMIRRSFSPIAVMFNARATDHARFLNKRAEMWWEMAKWVKRGGSLPRIEGLQEELTDINFTYVGDKMQLEPKEFVKKRLGRSPNKGDGLALTFALPEMNGSMYRAEVGTGHKNDYDPLSPERM